MSGETIEHADEITPAQTDLSAPSFAGSHDPSTSTLIDEKNNSSIILTAPSQNATLESIQWLDGGMSNMNSITNTVDEIRAEIRQVRRYLEQLEETERQLTRLTTARKMILAESPSDSTAPANKASPPTPTTPPLPPQDQRPLTVDIVGVLGTAGRPMSIAEIHEALEKVRGRVQKNVLTSTLTRLFTIQRIKRPEMGKYAAMGPHDILDETAILKHDATRLAYSILREAGKPLTTDQLWEAVKVRRRDASKHSLIGGLYRNSRMGRIFTLEGDKTFGLREWQNRHAESQATPMSREEAQPVEANAVKQTEEGDLIAEVQTLSH